MMMMTPLKSGDVRMEDSSNSKLMHCPLLFGHACPITTRMPTWGGKTVTYVGRVEAQPKSIVPHQIDGASAVVVPANKPAAAA
jgi:hypothetical protein